MTHMIINTPKIKKNIINIFNKVIINKNHNKLYVYYTNVNYGFIYF
uniref:Uncharacterized protein n=1 Tax=viral metagenome TaxID=1070528 RepID=A0A6C0H7G9_9ZZZZ